jgi:uncharacterized membrane protein
MASIERAAIKSAAKAQLKQNFGVILGSMLILGILLAVSSFTFVGGLILAGPFALGLAIVVLKSARGENPNVGDAFRGFKQFGGSFVAFLLSMIFTCLWSLLLIIPGVIAQLRYSQAYFIMNDNPEISGSDAIKKSKEMMKGHKGELFVLLLSFFPWYLLGCVTFGLAFLWICPYIYQTLANYYEELKKPVA